MLKEKIPASLMTPEQCLRACSFTDRRLTPTRELRDNLCGLASGERTYVRGVQWLAANGPVPAFVLIDPHPGVGAQVFAFDLQHRSCHAGDELLLLCRRKDVLDHVDGNKRHGRLLGVLDPASGQS